MHILKIIKITMVLLLSVFTITEAQVNPVYKKMKQRGWTPLSSNIKTKINPDQLKSEFLISMGYKDTTVSKLQKLGVNLGKLTSLHRPLDEKILTAVSDCIIIGTVTKKEYPLTKRTWYHTIAHVQVEEFLRNDYNLSKDQIPILIESGPTAAGEKDIRVGEDTLEIGEHVLLFLDANGLIRLANNNHMSNLYDELVNDSSIKFRILAKYDLKSGKASRREEVKNLVDVRDKINIILTALNNRIPISK